MSLGGKLFCGLLVVIGVGIAGANVETAWVGYQLSQKGAQAEAEITARRIDKPHGPSRASVTSVSVNGVGVQSPREWVKTYMLELRYRVDGVVHTADAPVTRTVWRDLAVGDRLAVTALPGAGYADAEDGATLGYAMKRLAIGGVIAVVGLVAFRLNAAED